MRSLPLLLLTALVACKKPAPLPPVENPAHEGVAFVAVGDTGKGNAGQRQVAEAIRAHCAVHGCDFAVLLGDNIYEAGVSGVDDPQWQSKFEEPYAALPFPFYVVLGNHDHASMAPAPPYERAMNEVAYSAHSAKWKLPARFWRERPSPELELVGLDTSPEMNAPDEEQRAALAGWFSAPAPTWRIALGHHPYRSNGPHGNAGHYDGASGTPLAGVGFASLLETQVCGKADLYLSGHDHDRQWLAETCQGTALVVSGAGAEGYPLPGANPVEFQSDREGFLYVHLVGRRLEASFVDADGNVDFTRVITK